MRFEEKDCPLTDGIKNKVFKTIETVGFTFTPSAAFLLRVGISTRAYTITTYVRCVPLYYYCTCTSLLCAACAYEKITLNSRSVQLSNNGGTERV